MDAEHCNLGEGRVAKRLVDDASERGDIDQHSIGGIALEWRAYASGTSSH
jgi:hypothetical protein